MKNEEKNSNDNKLRLLYLAKILYERTDEDTLLSGNELIAILDSEYGIHTHRQTLVSSVADLVEFGLDIETIPSRNNYYHIVSREFELSELKLLIDAVASNKFIGAAQSKNLIEKLSKFTSKNKSANLKRNIEAEGRIRNNNSKIFLITDAVNTAINENKKISFLYQRYDGSTRKHTLNDGKPYIFSPHRLVWNGDYYYMIGWSDKHDGVATFRIDRIKDVPDILKEKAHKMPKDFKLDEFLNTTFRMFNSKREEVTLECSVDTMDSIVDKFGTGLKIKVKNTEKEKFEITIKTAVNHLFYGWVFGFGGKVKILAPEDAVEGYAEMVRKAMKAIK